MPLNQFAHYVQLCDMTFPPGADVQPAERRPLSAQYSDEDRHINLTGRAETALEDAGAKLANALTVKAVELWMRPKFFRTPFTSIAACLAGGHLVIPTKVANPHLQLFVDVVRTATYTERWALAEALEHAWYSRMPTGGTASDAFTARGIPLKTLSK